MKMLRMLSRVGVALLAGAFALAAAGNKEAQLIGRIIAYRPAERVSQTPSHAINSEAFLLNVDGSRSRSNFNVIKLVYKHLGYSDLDDEFLTKMPTLRLKAHRDPTCDESYGAFVTGSPVATDESKKASTERIIFIGSFRGTKLQPEQPLKCYVMKKGDFQIDTPVPTPTKN